MATIETLSTSITKMPYSELETLVSNIRTVRRTKPEKKKRPAKLSKRPSKTKPKQQDLFALAGKMTPEQKKKMLEMILAKEGSK